MKSAIGFSPKDVVMRVPPLGDTMGRSEREHAAAMLVRVCQARGNRWQPVPPKAIGEVLKADIEAKREPWHSLNRNPFFRPDFDDLIKHGFARWCHGDGTDRSSPIELTAIAIARIGARWVHSRYWRRRIAGRRGIKRRRAARAGGRP